ncbi:class I SAM-dependent methyltransferase [Puniceicoccaceae bacterium K14]|nr:class I SAM-dependent methyltransferase [Puniceicoccaceae bacterium K14]
MPLTLEHIRWAYRLFLDREPDSDETIRPHIEVCQDTKQLRYHLFNSIEYLEKNPSTFVPAVPGNGARLEVELDSSPESMLQLFAKVESTWEGWGDVDAHWSVMSQNEFKTEELEVSRDLFEKSGKADAEIIRYTLERNGLNLDECQSCIEIGCGTGRITRWLSTIFSDVFAYDISSNHLRKAEEYLKAKEVERVSLLKFNSLNDMSKLPKTDFVFSVIVLQHNPPPVIKFMIQSILECLNPGGLALFQVPTYLKDYSFKIDSYLKTPIDSVNLEMHVIPQCDVFKIAEECNCSTVEVVEDDCIGKPRGSVSNTFLLKKHL